MNIYFAENNGAFGDTFLKTNSSFARRENKNATEIGSIDLLIVDGSANIDDFNGKKVDTVILPSYRYFDVTGKLHANSIISCGMNSKDDVTYSSIGYTDSMICIRDDIDIMSLHFNCLEFKSTFDMTKSLFQNISLGLLNYFIAEWNKNGRKQN